HFQVRRSARLPHASVVRGRWRRDAPGRYARSIHPRGASPRWRLVLSDPLPEIVVTSQDYERLSGLLESLPSGHPVVERLAAELDRAEIVESDEIPPDIVTMNSRVMIEDADTGEQREVTLV